MEACIRSGTPQHLGLAREILQQNMVERNIEKPTPANQRILNRIHSYHCRKIFKLNYFYNFTCRTTFG